MTTPTLKLPTSYTLCLSPSGQLLAAIGRNVVVANLQSRIRLHSSHPLSHPSDADFSKDDRLLAIKSTWGEIVVLDAKTGAKINSYRPKRQDEGAQIRFSPDDSYLVDASWSGDIRVRKTYDLSQIEVFGHKGEMIHSVSRNAVGSRW